MTKICTKCKTEKPIEDFYKDKASRNGRRPDCKKCKNSAMRKILTPDYQFSQRMKSVYGLTRNQYDEMVLKQNRSCAICKRSEVRLVVDHCHNTDVVRGLLCYRCNTLVGYLETDPAIVASAKDYLA